MTKLLISIVVFNHTLEQIKPTLDSIFSLKDTIYFELVIIDNGTSGAFANMMCSQTNFHYIKAPSNLGYGSGHNLAIQKFAKYFQYYLVCNPDVQFDADCISVLLSRATSLDCGLLMPAVFYPNGDRQELCKLLPSPKNLFLRRFFPKLGKKLDDKYLLRQADFTQSFFVPSLSGCFMLFDSKALIAEGGFDERYFMYMEDVDLSRRIASKYGALFVSDVKIIHDFQKASYSNYRMLFAHVVSAIKYFNKWGWLVDSEREVLNRKCLENLPLKPIKDHV